MSLSKFGSLLPKLILPFRFNAYNRYLSTTHVTFQNKNSEKPVQKGLLLGAFTGCEKTDVTLTPIAQRYASEINYDFKSALTSQLGLGPGEVRVFDNLNEDYRAVAVVGLGPEPPEDVEKDKNVFQRREYVRNAAGAGAQKLQERGIDEIFVEHMLDGEAAAEGATLGVWLEQQFKNYEDQLTESKVFLYEKGDEGKHKEMWDIGFEKAKGQNLARYLTALPANVMTPEIFGEHCAEELCPCGVSVEVHDHNWIKSKGMEAFLAIAQGSCTPPVLVEMKYSGGGSADPIVMVGKGCTFDSGGICLTPCKTMMYQHADMAGAAVIAGVFKALCKLKTKINLTALLPMYENMPSENAVKTGSVLRSLNERTIRVLHPVHDGRVVLSDVLSYAACLNPGNIINIATLSKSMMTAMGTGASGIFATNETHYRLLHLSGEDAGDRVWPFPFYDDINLANAKAADFGNRNMVKGGSTLFGASFLKEFVPPPPVDFMHIDITGTTISNKLFPSTYLRDGYATGRPTRSLVDFLTKLGQAEDKE
ncbi:cytosol aminopeptidase-like [Macrosteles quadrilineatus]|uniref:cytosol aminopeptidase-like n=1 Tax=Macrosteles quadrilineatus TaxID=74068 RepID=UPI0023E1D921|nr:cytosol aminopeptidase-like [Macrosteles quadrilineatus]